MFFKQNLIVTTTEENKAIACHFCQQAWGKANLALVDEMADQNFMAFYSFSPEPIKGRENFKLLVADLHTAFPDLHFTIEETIAEADKVVIRWIARGIHQGEMKSLNLPATHKFAEWSGIIIYQITDGKVVEERGEDDLLGLFKQIGAMAFVTSDA